MSEMNLEQLIATLKKEAVEEAENHAKEILDKARQEAQNIIRKAEAERDKTLEQAEEQAKEIQKKGTVALNQAAKEVSLRIRHDLLLMLSKVLKNEVNQSFNPKLLEQVILMMVEKTGTGVSVRIPEKLESELGDQIRERLNSSQNIKQWIPDDSLLNKFIISKTDEGWSYEISPEAVSELLLSSLSPKWNGILKKSDKA